MKSDKRLRVRKCSANKKVHYEASACRKFAGNHLIASLKFMITSLAFLLTIHFNSTSIWASLFEKGLCLRIRFAVFRDYVFSLLGRWRCLASPAKCEQQRDKATKFLLLRNNGMSITNCINSVSFRLTKKAAHLSKRLTRELDFYFMWFSSKIQLQLDLHRCSLASWRSAEKERETR